MDRTRPQIALALLKSGGLRLGPEWQRAHELCQEDEGERAHDLVHALCHWIEGDTANRDYWYRRAQPWARAATIEAEWQALTAELG
jgi:hypothetical protein